MEEEYAAESAEIPGELPGTQAADEPHQIWTRARRLKPRQFEALWLRYAEGLDVAGVAAAMGVTRVHAKVLLFRARHELARRLGPPTTEEKRTMLTCLRSRGWLIRHDDDTPPPSWLQRHLAGCAACRTRHADHRR
ncbi:MAG: sigma factor-like helix-turn-helix DNA-binding protein, partial [Limisphaerales bacterium]